ncbi:MAG: 3-oxoacyl-ACP synthase III family protein [Planctomycetota bacterium]|jgi:3-oxoacyl-[acyl-carrier-protein] synthase-3
MSHPLRIEIRGTGASVPDQVLDNAFFAAYLDTSEEWILPRTGIRERRRVADQESTLTLALAASRRALDDAGMSAEEIDLVLVCTATPETQIPSTACWLQHALGLGDRGIAAFDLGAACSGFVYGLIVAGMMIESGVYHHVLLVGAETLTRITDYQDRATCILFGDGAGAAILAKSQDPERGVLYHELGADGARAKAVWVPAGGAKEPASSRTVNERLHYMRMNGRELFKFAVLKMEELIDRAVEVTGIKPQDIKLIIPHQSNLRIMESARRRIGQAASGTAAGQDGRKHRPVREHLGGFDRSGIG